MGGVHVQCLENWIRVKNIRNCEVCDEEYKIRRILKYGRVSSVFPFFRAEKVIIANGLLRIFVVLLLVMLENSLITYVKQNWRSDIFNSFIRFHVFIVWLFLHYFLMLECGCEVYHIYNRWQSWRTSIFTIRVLWKLSVASQRFWNYCIGLLNI